jgi:O-antigen biosynthesis protein
VFNRWRHTNACLRALAASLDPAISVEIILADDASDDRTRELLAMCGGIRVVRNDCNRGFIATANAGAAIASGRYVHFLNNDAFVSEGWLQPLLDALAGERVGAAVSQLRYPDETLAEAGGVIWRNGLGSNYGRGDSPANWRYRTPRDIDYGSAASLMVRRDAFEKAEAFSPSFEPAYYEDADLCFALRAGGLRVVYEPRSVVYHAEGVSYGSNVRGEARALQERNRTTFVKRWSRELQRHEEANAAKIDKAARRLGGRTVLVVDEHVPFFDRDAGSRRTAAIAELFRARGWHVLFGSIDPVAHEPYAARLRSRGVEVIPGFDERALAAIAESGIAVDLAWLCRPSTAQRFTAAFRSATDAKVVFDTVDLHFLRLQRMQEVRKCETGWRAMRDLELALARDADMTIATSAREAAILEDEGVRSVGVMPVVERPASSEVPWRARAGVVFLGNYAHAPNVDAAQWLCNEVMPIVWKRLPHARVTLAGADPTREVRALQRANVAVTGFVDDAPALLAKHRVFAAPIRFGAGVKGKIVYALAHGIPVVTTQIGAEGIFAAAEYDGIALGAREVAERIVHVHENEAAWNALAESGRSLAQRFSPEAAGCALDEMLERLYAD